MIKKVIYAVLGAIAAILAFFGLKALANRKSKVGPAATSDKEMAAVEKQTEALMRRARVEATGEIKKAQIDKIMKIEDPRERLDRLAEELKDL